MADLSAAPSSVEDIRTAYTEHTQRKRLYGGIMLALFVALMVAGFRTADDRNAGSFADGFHRIFDYPAKFWQRRLKRRRNCRAMWCISIRH